MAVGRSATDGPGETRVSFGEFELSGDTQVKLTITKSLDSYDFPNHDDASVRVELVETPEDGPNRLEVIPVED